ncbi:MAG: helix-turn-helix transcriptional regulator [Terriglobales bacterium]
MSQPLANYLRAYRKRSGLTQREVALLLGCRDGGQVSRYEKQHYLPPLRTALACGVIFRVPLTQLFAGIQAGIVKEIADRIVNLRLELEAKLNRNPRSALTLRKLHWLEEHHGRDQTGPGESS